MPKNLSIRVKEFGFLRDYIDTLGSEETEMNLDVYYYRGFIEFGRHYHWREGYSKGKEVVTYPWRTMKNIKKYEKTDKPLIFVDKERKSAKWANGKDATKTAQDLGLF